MRAKRLLPLWIATFLAFTMLGCSLFGTQNKANPSPVRANSFHACGFYVNDPGGFDSLPSLKAHSNVLDEINPLWYHAKPDGSLVEDSNKEAIAFAKSKKIQVVPLVNVVPNQDSVLTDPKARDNAIANIVRVVKANNYDGADIDFEFVPTTGKKDFSVDRDLMTKFMQLLDGQMKKLGKQTHMAVLPQVGVTPEMAGVYDYSKLTPYVKVVTLMVYDHSQEGSPPGPLAPFNWVEQNIKMAIKQGFKPSQICLGVATYGYDWPAGKSGGFSTPSKKVLQNATIKGYQIKWSDKYQEPYYIYQGPDGTKREVWFENAATLKTKLQLVEKYKLEGICIWRLGFEDKSFWDTLVKRWGTKK